MKWSLHRVRLLPLLLNLEGVLALRKPHLGVVADNSIVAPIDGRIAILVPAVDWERGLLHTVPVLAGYFIVWDNGKIEYVDASQIREHYVFRKLAEAGYKIPVIPEKLAREWVELYRWHVGWAAVAIYHDTFDIRDVGVNRQPYLVLDDTGHLWWLFVVEPAGESYAVKHIIYVDAESVEPRILVYTPPEEWIGASRVLELVKSAHPSYNWEDYHLEEPTPLVVNGRLYWKVATVTENGRGLVAIDVVDAETGAVHTVRVGHRLTPADFDKVLYSIAGAGDTGAGGEDLDVEERIARILEEIRKLQNQLRELEAELQELQEALSTRGP